MSTRIIVILYCRFFSLMSKLFRSSANVWYTSCAKWRWKRVNAETDRNNGHNTDHHRENDKNREDCEYCDVETARRKDANRMPVCLEDLTFIFDIQIKCTQWRLLQLMGSFNY